MNRLGYLKSRLNKAKVKGYVNDAGDYDHVRQLVVQQRLRPLLGNLLGDKGMHSIAAAARQLGVAIRVLYLSNAEQYWAYRDVFRDNVRDLPLAADSWVARTSAVKPMNGDYRYYLHNGQRFQNQLADPKIRSVGQLLSYAAIEDRSLVPLIKVDGDGRRTLRWADDKDKEWRKKLAAEKAAQDAAGKQGAAVAPMVAPGGAK
jgi:hypothetical protein